MSKNATWLDAFYSSSLQLKAECGVVFLALDDLAKDRSDRLLVLLVGYELSHLKILNGTDVHCEISLPEMAVAICTFSIAGSLPGIAIGAGSSLYIYKNFKPYYKYNIPQGGPDYTEEVEITAIASLPRSSADVSSTSLLLIGTAHRYLLIVDPHTFNAISRIEISSIPTFIKCSGCYDVEAFILIGTPDAGIFVLKTDCQPMEVKPFISLSTQIVEMAFNGSSLAVATSDRTVKYYTLQGQELRKITVEDFILTITWVEIKNQDISLLAVALANGVVSFYRHGSLVELLRFNVGINSMICGRFGREEGVLIMISKDGELIVKILNRGYKASQQPSILNTKATANLNKKKPPWPAKTKLFVEQTMREKEDPAKMYQLFQEGICKLHLRALQTLQESTNTTSKDVQQLPVESVDKRCVHLIAKLLGSGARFLLQLLLQNISDQVIESLTVLLQVTNGKLVLERSCVKFSLILPASQHWIKLNVQDPTSQGGQVSVIVTKNMEPTLHGKVICVAEINISPTI